MRRFSIGAVLIAIVSLIIFTAWPHHHHNDKLCMKVEMCKHDHSMNDRHTSHHGEGAGERSCLVSITLHSLKAFKDMGEGWLLVGFLLLFCCLWAVGELFRLTEKSSRKGNTAWLSGYVSATLGRYSGLRAPPVFVC